MMAKKQTSGPIPVNATVHADKRANIPTADAHEFISPEIEAPARLSWEMLDRGLDPQLVWKGKNETETTVDADAPPIYIQEKIDPRVLVENLRRTSASANDEPELTLFDTFDGLGELDIVDFYRHDANWSNRMVLGDSLQVMASLSEREGLRGKVQMIYIDPPYGIKFGSNWQRSARKRDVKDGKLEDATFEAEQIKAFRDTWELGIHSYLGYLRDRLVAARDLLTGSGSVFVQIGDENVHLVRALLDEVFGNDNFVAQIAFKTTGGATGANLAGTLDYVLWFARDLDHVRVRSLYRAKEVGGPGGAGYDLFELPDGTRLRPPDAALLPEGSKRFQLTTLMSQSVGREKGEGAASWFPVELDGQTFRPSMQARWKTNESGMARLLLARRVAVQGRTIRYVRYFDDFVAFPITTLWDDTQTGSGMDKIYVVQTNGKVIQRCMLMCTDPGDLVLDPTCGSGTTAFVAEQWGRRWITVDTSRVALALARQRLMGARFPYYLLADALEGRRKEQSLTASPVPTSTPTNDIRRGFVYERVQHVTLKSIANNPDIKEGMSRHEIDLAIKRHAEFELLYDRPYEDSKKVRVTGPFTVESLSPHRSLAFAGQGPADPIDRTKAEEAADLEVGAPTFDQMILDNLAKAGVQNGRRNERLTFESVEPWAGTYIQAVAERSNAPHGVPKRVAISVGPQYGTVGPSFIKGAALEAIRASEIDLLCVLAFAFDPQALGATDDVLASDQGFANVAAERNMGRVPVLLVRMNNDLLMGEELKKTGAGNLFTVFGEPDIDIRRTAADPDGGADQIVVEILGVDVYDPTTGEVRSNDTDLIALWMIDTNYNGESFFVRHCYFTGGNDPYARLKKALKADIDEDAWASLYRTTSRPFAAPESGKIAVKVINDYGDEVMQVFTVV
jgi:adenine-specific DNA-methyltransferase